MQRVALIPGHSTTDPGAINTFTGHTEYDYNLKLAYTVARKLAANGRLAPVIVHRSTYRDLPTKVNQTGAVVAVEFHCNAFNTRATGTEMLHWHTSVKGKHLAHALQDAALKALQLTDRGVKPIDGKSRGSYLLEQTSMPCVIAESFFIDNIKDLSVGLDNYEELAIRYADAIEAFLK